MWKRHSNRLSGSAFLSVNQRSRYHGCSRQRLLSLISRPAFVEFDMTNSQSRVQTGSRDGYDWLVSSNTLDEVLQLCPEVVLGRYVAVTSFDSGPLLLNDEERAAGWEVHSGIAYSPKIQRVEMMPRDQFDEWYIFGDRVNLGQLVPSDRNVFESQMQQGQVHAFVNFGGFALHRPDVADLAPLFWEQLNWIHPESYLAEGDYLIFVTANKDLFLALRDALRN